MKGKCKWITSETRIETLQQRPNDPPDLVFENLYSSTTEKTKEIDFWTHLVYLN